MSTLQLSATANYGAGTIQGKTPHAVEVRSKWSGSWRRVNYLRCMNYVDTVAPSVGKAVFKFEFGSIKREDRNAFYREQLLSLDNYFIRTVLMNGSSDVLWTGEIDVENLLPFGGDSNYNHAGDQIFTAFGLAHELDREAIRTAQIDSSGKTIDWVPDLNVRYEYGVGPLGNRSNSTGSDNAYYFSADGGQWSAYDAANMILARYTPLNGPAWVLGGQADVLRSLVMVWPIQGLTPWQALQLIIPRSRGLGFFPMVSGDKCVLYVFSALEKDASYGNVKIPANANPVNLELNKNIFIRDPEICRSSPAFDQIEARGARCLTCFSVSYASGTAEKGWTAARQTAYNSGASAASGYGSLTAGDKSDLNDRYRGDPAFDEVYMKHRIPKGWNGQGGSVGPTAPALLTCDNDGNVSVDPSAAFYQVGKAFERMLPLEEGKDYSVSPPTSAGQPANLEPSYLRPFALIGFVDANSKQRYVMVDQLDGDNESARADVMIYPRELAFGVKAQPRHLYALTDFASAQPSNTDALLDYTKLIATMAMRTDTVLKVVAKRPDLDPTARIKTKIVEVPECEFWYLASGTVVGCDANLNLLTAPAQILRDDSDTLRNIAAFLLAWYGVSRSSVRVPIRSLIRIPLGVLLTDVLSVGLSIKIGSVITSVAVNLENDLETTLQAGWFEVDFAEA